MLVGSSQEQDEMLESRASVDAITPSPHMKTPENLCVCISVIYSF